MVLDNGKVIEYDTPSNLLKKTNSIFYGMAKESGLLGSHQTQTKGLDASPKSTLRQRSATSFRENLLVEIDSSDEDK